LDLFNAILAVSATRQTVSGLPLLSSSPFAHLLNTFSAFDGGTLSNMVCSVPALNDSTPAYATPVPFSACHNDAAGPRCTISGSSGRCKLADVNGCICPQSLLSFPTGPTANVQSRRTSIALLSRSDPSRWMTSESTTMTKIRFMFLLQYTFNFRPRSVDEVLSTYKTLFDAVSAVYTNRTLNTKYGIDLTSFRSTFVYVPPPPTPIPPTPEPPPPPPNNDLYGVLAILVVPVAGMGYGGYRLAKYLRWRNYARRFTVRKADPGDASGDVEMSDMDDPEFEKSVGSASWVSKLAGKEGVGGGGESAPGGGAIGPESIRIDVLDTFDPIAESTRRMQHPGDNGVHDDGSHATSLQHRSRPVPLGERIKMYGAVVDLIQSTKPAANPQGRAVFAQAVQEASRNKRIPAPATALTNSVETSPAPLQPPSQEGSDADEDSEVSR